MRGVAMAISAVVSSPVAPSHSTGPQAGRRARRVPGLTASRASGVQRDPRGHLSRRRRPFRAVAGVDVRRRAGCSPAGRRAVRLREEHACPGDRRTRPAQIPGDRRGSLKLDDEDASCSVRSDVAARVGLLFQDPTTQLVMERVEDDVAFGLENRGWPRTRCAAGCPRRSPRSASTGWSARRTGSCRADSNSGSRWPGRSPPRPGLPGARRTDRQPRPGGASARYRRARDICGRGNGDQVLIEHRVDRAWPLPTWSLRSGGRPAHRCRRAGRRCWQGPPARCGQPASGCPDEATAADGDAARRRRGGTGPVILTARRRPVRVRAARPSCATSRCALTPGRAGRADGTERSGKSTLARLLVGLLRPSDGESSLAGDPAPTAGRRARAPRRVRVPGARGAVPRLPCRRGGDARPRRTPGAAAPRS